VAEFDTPAELIKRGGKFYELAREAGLLDSDGSISSQKS
jgi:ATP-binding cassette subfamily C (CFTR/MRP) protein 1